MTRSSSTEAGVLRGSLRRRVLVLAFTVGSFYVGNPAWAQTKVATLEEMRDKVSIGDRVVLVRTNGDSVAGRLQRFGADDIEIGTEVKVTAQRQRAENVIVPQSAIRSLERKRDASKGTWIGFGVGAGIGGVLFASAFAQDANEADEWGPGYILFGAVIAGGGALIGRAFDHSKPHLRYESATVTKLRFDAAPIHSADRRGLKVAIRF